MKRTASLNIRKARALDKLEKLEAWRQSELKRVPERITETFHQRRRALESERDAAIANVPAVVGVKYQERYVKLLATFDEDVRKAIESDAL